LQKQRLSGSAIRRARLLLPPAAAVPGVLHSYAYGVLGRYETLRINIRFEFEPKQINMEATAQFAVDVVAPPAPAHMPRPFAQLAAQSSLRYTQIVFQKNTEVLRLQLGITSVGVLCSRRVLLTFFYLFYLLSRRVQALVLIDVCRGLIVCQTTQQTSQSPLLPQLTNAARKLVRNSSSRRTPN
jgi:hypothetical protein